MDRVVKEISSNQVLLILPSSCHSAVTTQKKQEGTVPSSLDGIPLAPYSSLSEAFSLHSAGGKQEGTVPCSTRVNEVIRGEQPGPG